MMPVFRLMPLAFPALLAACGGGGGDTAPQAPAAPVLEMLAGTTGGPGYFDATGPAARFYYPEGIAVDGSGTIYVADSGNAVIRRISPEGVVTTLAGSPTQAGFVDGQGAAARFGADSRINGLQSLAVDGRGNIYVADTASHSIRMVTPSGMVTTAAGTGVKGSADGPAATATFSSPYAVTVDHAGNVYVGDTGNATIRRISPDGMVTTVAGMAGQSGYRDGLASNARFGGVVSLAVDGSDNVYIADSGNQVIRKLAPDGAVTTFAGTPGVMGSDNGRPGSFYATGGLAVDSQGNVFVVDRGNHSIRKVAPDGTVSNLAGGGSQPCPRDGPAASAQFQTPAHIAIAPSGTMYVTEDGVSVIRAISSTAQVTTFAGTVVNCDWRDGHGTDARFGAVSDLAADAVGNLVVADGGARTMRKVTPDGDVSTLPAPVGIPYAAVGYASSGTFFIGSYQFPLTCRGLAPCDPAGSLQRMTAGGEMTPVAPSANTDGSGMDINIPGGLAVVANGDLYFTDSYADVIRKLSAAGDLTTWAGLRRASGSADGMGSSARFWSPGGIVADPGGNLYVADGVNQTIRAISASGSVTTMAGSPGVSGNNDGVGSAARFNMPTGLAIDDAGYLYVADTFNCLIRKVSPSGAVATVVGTAGRCGFTGGALPGTIDRPRRVVVRGTDLYIAMDTAIAVVRNRP